MQCQGGETQDSFTFMVKPTFTRTTENIRVKNTWGWDKKIEITYSSLCKLALNGLTSSLLHAGPLLTIDVNARSDRGC